VDASVTWVKKREADVEKPMEGELSFRGRTYQEIEKISEGSFGVVLKVLDVARGTHLVAKVFEEEEWVSLSDDEEESTMSSTALREVSFMHLLTKMEAPHTARLLDFGFSIGDYLALVVYMPLYCGDLSDAIRDKMLDVPQRLQISCDVLSAMSFMHGCTPAIVHRDIKPENVLLDGRHRGFLTDFGFACFVSDHGEDVRVSRNASKSKGSSSSSSTDPEHSGVLGTVTYIAPEVLDGAHPHPAADAWATGVLLMELLENERLDADTDSQAFKLLKKKRATLDEALLLQRTIKGFLQEDPEKRLAVQKAYFKLRGAGLSQAQSESCKSPTFSPPNDIVVSFETELLCQKLRTVVVDTLLAAEIYSRRAPDVDPRILAIIAAKVHEHRPRSDEGMVEDLGVTVDALEAGQAEMLRRLGGCLVLQSLAPY
jgi:serine/threonine protein kinase